jgi:hypothetical protein
LLLPPLLLLLLLQAAGQKGQRFSMKNTRIMMTQPMGELALVQPLSSAALLYSSPCG